MERDTLERTPKGGSPQSNDELRVGKDRKRIAKKKVQIL